MTTNELRKDPLYSRFISGSQFYGDRDRACIENCVQRLVSIQTNTDHPGMLLGKIQSGKTKTYLGAIALAFDNDYDIAIILTKGTKALARQTLRRVAKEFAPFIEEDRIQVFDIMAVPAGSGLTPYELNQKLVIVSKKQSDNLDRLIRFFQTSYPMLATRRILLIDDEADYASVGFRLTPDQVLEVNRTTSQLEQLRTLLTNSAFLQVTATPYSLYLQPRDMEIRGMEFKPIRPAFTELVPVDDSYIGSEYYFDHSANHASVASFIYHPVTREELEILHHEDRRRFRIEQCLESDAINSIREALCNFVLGGCIRRLQDEEAGVERKRFSFLVHTEASKAAHEWQERVVSRLLEDLRAAVVTKPAILQSLFQAAYGDLSRSISAMNHYLPSREEAISQAITAIRDGWIMIAKVNSETQVEALLDEDGQLRLRTPLNLFIGGQILDRGLTIANMIGFFYGRRPHIYQQDTVLQHSRMFGFRPLEDLTVTRFYTAPEIHAAMRRMHESDVALRETLEHNPDHAVVFIRRDPGGHVIPCSPNKILISKTTTLRPFSRILPVGFQTDYKTRTHPIIEKMDKILEALANDDDREPFEIELGTALELLEMCEKTLIMDDEHGYTFDWRAARAALRFMSESSTSVARRGKVWCLLRTGREMQRFQPALGEPHYSDAPDTAQREGVVARRIAIDTPMLIMIRENGKESHGWRDTPFYWPVIMAPGNWRTSIFAHEVVDPQPRRSRS